MLFICIIQFSISALISNSFSVLCLLRGKERKDIVFGNVIFINYLVYYVRLRFALITHIINSTYDLHLSVIIFHRLTHILSLVADCILRHKHSENHIFYMRYTILCPPRFLLLFIVLKTNDTVKRTA